MPVTGQHEAAVPPGPFHARCIFPEQKRLRTATVARTLPFLLFMAFIAFEEAAGFLSRGGYLSLPQGALYYLYPLKALSVALLLYLFRHDCMEFDLGDLKQGKRLLAVVAIGIATFGLWVFMDWTLTLAGHPAGFDPRLLPAGMVRVVLTLVRVAGAVLVVPLMEELFWRSFLLRYLVAADFKSVPLGTFTWSSFLVTAVLFGLEHHFFFAGVMAGVVYSLILYKTRSIAHCVLAHAVTNLALAFYVLYTGKWYFW
jgi:uncharacterized protein